MMQTIRNKIRIGLVEILLGTAIFSGLTQEAYGQRLTEWQKTQAALQILKMQGEANARNAEIEAANQRNEAEIEAANKRNKALIEANAAARVQETQTQNQQSQPEIRYADYGLRTYDRIRNLEDDFLGAIPGHRFVFCNSKDKSYYLIKPGEVYGAQLENNPSKKAEIYKKILEQRGKFWIPGVGLVDMATFRGLYIKKSTQDYAPSPSTPQPTFDTTRMSTAERQRLWDEPNPYLKAERERQQREKR